MGQSKISNELRSGQDISRLVSYGLVTLMMVCAVLTFGSLIHWLMPSWPSEVMAAIACLVAIDRFYVYRRDLHLQMDDRLVRGVVQAIILVIIAKLAAGMSQGSNAFLSEISRWRTDFLGTFFNFTFFLMLITVLFVWFLAGNFASLLEEIRIERALVNINIEAASGKVQPSAREQLVNLIFTTLIFLAASTALMRIDLRSMFTNPNKLLLHDLPVLAGGGLTTLMYFMLGLVLLSQTRLQELQTRWHLANIPVLPTLTRHWIRYSLLFLAILVLVVGLLPTSYSIGLFDSLGLLLGFILTLIIIFVELSMALVSYLFYLLTRGRGGTTAPRFPPFNFSQFTPQASSTAIQLPLWDVVKSIIFWGIFIAVISFSIIQYLRQHQDILLALRKVPGWRFFAQFWQWVSGFFAGVRIEINKAIEERRERLRARRLQRELGGSGFLNLRQLNPRQRIYFYYQALIRRGAENELPRSVSQTPYEYASSLDRALPEVNTDIDSLTEAFVEARYSNHPVEQEKVSLVKAMWERIRKALRGKEK
jgi:uncharacterized protein DUF4129